MGAQGRLTQPTPRPHALARHVRDDAIEPRSERTSLREPAHVAKGLDETVLSDIFGEAPVAGQQIGEPERLRLVARDEWLQPIHISLLAAANRLYFIHVMARPSCVVRTH